MTVVRPRPRSTARWAAAMLLAVLGVTACSSSDGTPSTTTTGGLESIDGPASVDSGVVASQP